MPQSITPEAIDASTVPLYPVVRLSVSELEELAGTDGLRSSARWTGSVDGVGLVCGDKQLVHDLLVEAAAVRADRRPQKAVRVLFIGDDLAASEAAIVTVDGEILAEGVTSTAPGEGRRLSGRLALVAGAIFLGAAGLTAVGVSVAAGWGREAAVPVASPTATATQLPVLPPSGWASVASWSAPVGAGYGAGAGAVGVGRVVIVPSATPGAVVALDQATGAPSWSASVPGGVTGSSLAGGPLLARMGTRQVVVAWSASTVAAWDPSTGAAVGSWSLPADASQVTVMGDRVLVAGQTRHVGVLGRDGLVWRVLPAGAKPVGATAQDELLAIGSGRLWRSASNTVAGAGVPLAGPQAAVWTGQAMIAGDALVVAYAPKAASNMVVLRAFDVATGSARWTSGPVRPAVVGAYSTVLWVSPTGTWGVYGSTWVDLATGATKVLPQDWVTTAIGATVAFGTSASRPGAVSAAGVASVESPTTSSDGGPATPPVGVTDRGDALVIAPDGQTSRLYFVPRAISSSTALPSALPSTTASLSGRAPGGTR